jgi:hypothetical protein
MAFAPNFDKNMKKALDKKALSKYAGRLYIVGTGGVTGISGSRSHSSLQIFRSLDDGKTFLGRSTPSTRKGWEMEASVRARCFRTAHSW